MKRKIIAVILILLLATLLLACGQDASRGGESIGGGQTITYYYDEVHEVSIWVYDTSFGGGAVILPGGQVKNPELPMK